MLVPPADIIFIIIIQIVIAFISVIIIMFLYLVVDTSACKLRTIAGLEKL